MAVAISADKNLKIAESAEEALILQKYGIIAVDAGTIERIRRVLEELKIQGIDLVVTIRPEIQQPAAQQAHTAQSNKPSTGKAPFDGLSEDQRWELIKDTLMSNKKLSMFGELISVDIDNKVWRWNGQTFRSISSLANQIANATGRRGQWNGWAILRITE